MCIFPWQISRIDHTQGRDDISSGLNSFFLIYAGALVFFMQLGFAMLCAGSIREKNVKNVLLWNLLDSAGGAFGFWYVLQMLRWRLPFALNNSSLLFTITAGLLVMRLHMADKISPRERLSLATAVFS
jgi:ammonia channel protein AmtB